MCLLALAKEFHQRRFAGAWLPRDVKGAAASL